MLEPGLCQAMRSMTGFRNIAVRQHEELDVDIVKHIAHAGRRDFLRYCAALGVQIKEPSPAP